MAVVCAEDRWLASKAAKLQECAGVDAVSEGKGLVLLAVLVYCDETSRGG